MAVARYHAEDQYLETFTELQHYLIHFLSPKEWLIKQWPTATRTHSILIVRLPAFKSKLIFWEYQDSQFLTLPSLGGSHHCVAACRAEWYGVLYLVVSCTYLLKQFITLLAHRVTNDGLCTPLAVSHKPSYQGVISARKQSLVHRDIKF